MSYSTSFERETWRALKSDFKVFKYRFILEAKEIIEVPDFEGSTLRGGFGSAFKKVVCLEKEKDCTCCDLSESCVYSYVFASSPPENAPALNKFQDIPRPFVIEPPFDKNTYKPGEHFVFDLVLIGKANDYLPYFIYSFKELGKMGLGYKRRKFHLKKVFNINWQGNRVSKIFDIEDGKIDCNLNPIDWLSETKNLLKDINANKEKEEITINIMIETMLRMKFRKKIVNVPEFHIIIRNLFRRISALALFHCGFQLDLNFTKAIEISQKIILTEDKTRWYSWSRYSKRQNMRFPLGGIIGEVKFKGDIFPFLPYLVLGQYTHAGKGCVYGLGKYKLSF